MQNDLIAQGANLYSYDYLFSVQNIPNIPIEGLQKCKFLYS